MAVGFRFASLFWGMWLSKRVNPGTMAASVTISAVTADRAALATGAGQDVTLGTQAAASPSLALNGQPLTLPQVREDRDARPETPRRSRFGPHGVFWPLLLILALQAALSLRLVWSNTAFTDEALYLWAGRLELQHWLYGTPVPDFPGYFSGAPVVYPPLGALADAAGGLAGARLLSLGFMLTATALLYGTTRRLFGRLPGLLAALVFGVTAGTQFLGAFATYDAMALMLLALAAWLGVRAAGAGTSHSAFLLLGACGLSLAAADAAKYAAALWNPVILTLVFLGATDARGWRAGARALAVALGALLAAATVALRLGGHPYWQGIAFTTLSRQHGRSSPYGIFADSIGWVGIVAALALIGVLIVVCTRQSLSTRLMAVVLTGAILLAPAEQARMQVFTSLFKHVDFGAWFAAVMAGVALAGLAKAVPAAKHAAAIRVASVFAAATAAIGVPLAATHFAQWPSTSQLVTAMAPVLAKADGPVLAGDNGNVLQYYLPDISQRVVFYRTGFFRYQDPQSHEILSGPPAYADAIKHRFFSVVTLSFLGTRAEDLKISADITRYGGYRLVSALPYHVGAALREYRIWVRDGGA